MDELRKAIADISTMLVRVDQRTTDLTRRTEELASKVERALEAGADLAERVATLEARNGHRLDNFESAQQDAETRLVVLEVDSKRQSRGWERVIDAAWKVCVAVVAAYALLKLGLR